MNSITKCFAVVAIITFTIGACGGETSGESSGAMSNPINLSQLSPAAVRGFSIYEDPAYACSICHGRQGEGSAAGQAINNTNVCSTCADHATLTAYNEVAMPYTPYNPATCVGACASDASQYIIEAFIQGKALPGANNNPAVNVSPTLGLVTTEAAGMASFTVTLNSLPEDDVTIDLSSDNVLEGTVNPASLTFTRANWNQAQTVMVTGVDDNVLDATLLTAYNIITAQAMSNDPAYAGINPANIAVSNTDDEVVTPGVINVVPTAGLVTSEDGQTATFTIALGSAPTSDVSIGLTSSNAAEGAVSPSSVVFNAGNFNAPQTVTVTGVDDVANPMVDGNISYSIVTGAAISNDRSYTGVNVSDVAVTNNDNDVQPVIMTFTANPVTPIPFGGAVTLTWTSDGDACTAGGATAGGQWAGALLGSGSGTLMNLTTAGVNTFALICTTGGIDSLPASVNVAVEAQLGAPTVTLTANPAMNVPNNGSTTLMWTTTDATSCVASSNPANANWDNANKLPLVNGSQVIPNLTAANNTSTLACTNASNLVTTVNVNVTVIQLNPTVSLTASAAMIGEGKPVTLTWTTTDLASCAAVANPVNNQWTGAKGPASSNQAINALFNTTIFTLNCVGNNGVNVSDNATVSIDPTSTGQYLYNTETFGGIVPTCAASTCHGTQGQPGLFALTMFNKTALCAKFGIGGITGTAGIIQKIQDTMPLDAMYLGQGNLCGNECAAKIANYMFMNFYGANTTNCEGVALPLAIP